MTNVKLYHIPNIQHLVYIDHPNLQLENLPMNRFDTLVYKGEQNTIDFSVRDKDRKPINLLDKTLIIYVTNIETNTLVITRCLEKLDETKGFARFTLTEADTLDLPPTFYQYSVVVNEDEAGRSGFAFVDQVYRATGTFELRNGAIPNPNPTQTITTFVDQSAVLGFGSLANEVFVSGRVVANKGRNHSAIWTLTDYIGTIRVQGTLDTLPPTDDDKNWMDIATKTFTMPAGDGLEFFNWSGNYTFFRFMHEPSTVNTGTVDKVSYR